MTKSKLSTAQESILCRMINGANLRLVSGNFVCGEKKVHDSRTVHGLIALGLIDRDAFSSSLYEVTEAGREAYRS